LSSVLLFDGDCGFCGSIVRFVLDHERAHTLRFAALRSAAAARILRDNKELHGVDSVIWVDLDESGDPRKILVRSAAALHLVRYVGAWWRCLTVLWIVPRPIRDWAYDIVARHRHRIMGRENCPVPTSETRQRFLD
jgi:predicted DCC family thiol-disulfide oxidoreductase YuxK